jgi:hypothetical protein
MATRELSSKAQQWASLLREVRTPLGFFALIVLVAESLLLIALSSIPEKSHVLVIGAMLCMLFLVIALVTILAAFRPEALSGLRAQAAAPEPSVNLAGNWTMLMRTAEGRELPGTSTIKQESRSPYLKLLSEVFVPGRDSLLVTSVLGGIVEHEVYFIYRNSDGDMGVAHGFVTEKRPSKLTLDYRDLAKIGTANEPIGRVELTRTESAPNKSDRADGNRKQRGSRRSSA